MKLTRFEKARIIGARALQISMGAPILIKITEDIKDPLVIALKELDADAIPMTVKRNLPPKREFGAVFEKEEEETADESNDN
ncbi:MAG: DNA-directed RNA polymerase subunit K [Candidatus Hydrothermarchaeales archaeon]